LNPDPVAAHLRPERVQAEPQEAFPHRGAEATWQSLLI